jgi:hypothetical protein
MALKALYPTRDLMQKVIDRLGLYDKPQTDIANPIALLPYINFNIDVDELCKEPNYIDTTQAYAAGAGFRHIWTVPDDEIVIDPYFYVNTGDPARTITHLAVFEDDTLASVNNNIFAVAAAQVVEYTNTASIHVFYPGEAFAVLYAVNVAGGTATIKGRYIRLKTKEILL